MAHEPGSAPATTAYPGFSWVYRHPVRVLATGFGSGLIRPGPGTWGSLAGWSIWVTALVHMPDPALAVFLAFAFVLGCYVCHRTGIELGVPDHGAIVWDEMVAIWLVLWLSPASWEGQIAGFVLFRFFDILKPPPIRAFDRRWHNGFGVMWDDLLAAAYSLLVMALLVRLDLIS